MKIAYLTADFGVPVFGNKGASVHVNGMASALSELGHDVLVLTPNPGEIPSQNTKYRVVGIPLGGSWPFLFESLIEESICKDNRLPKDMRNLMYSSWLQLQAIPLLGEYQPDFIYERYSLFGTAGLHLKHHYKIPLILEVNAPLIEEQQQQRGLSLKKVAHTTQRMLFEKVDHVIVVSGWLKEYVIQHGVESGQVTVLPNGVDPTLFSPRSNSEHRHILGWKDKFVVGYVGSMKDWHGLSSLLEAIRMAIGDTGDLRLLLVGDGPQMPILKKYVHEMRLSDHVHFTGSVPHRAVAEWIATMDVAVVPFADKIMQYFSPVKMFEYMAMTCPVVAARISQTAEIIEPGRTGWLYTPGDSRELAERLLWMNENKEIIKQTGRVARQNVLSHHTWQQKAKCVINIAQELKEINNNIQIPSNCGLEIPIK